MAGFSDSVFVRAVNRLAVGLMNAPLVGRLVRRGMVVIRYTGRKSGRTFETPVSYRRTGDEVTVAVGMPDKKTWWRNFSGEGGALTFCELDGVDRTGHAVATRDPAGGVSVTVRLDPV